MIFSFINMQISLSRGTKTDAKCCDNNGICDYQYYSQYLKYKRITYI